MIRTRVHDLELAYKYFQNMRKGFTRCKLKFIYFQFKSRDGRNAFNDCNIHSLSIIFFSLSISSIIFFLADFKRILKATTGLDLTVNQVDVIFRVFDEDGDGYLNNQEFMHAMKGRQSRGLDSVRYIIYLFIGWLTILVIEYSLINL